MSSEYEPSLSADPEFKKRLASLYAIMAKKLGIKQAPKIVMTQSEENSANPFGLTAFYNPQERSIKLYITNRHPTDILRSFAHELIHHWQNEHNALPAQKSTGHEHYAQKDPVLRLREMEAYLMGNILFRDWQDEQRYGKINENLSVKDPDRVIKSFRDLLFNLIKSQAIGAYHRAGTSGDMDPNDFVEELSRKLELEIDKFLQIVNNRGNWENGQDMIKEATITRTELHQLIRERIMEMSRSNRKDRNKKMAQAISRKMKGEKPDSPEWKSTNQQADYDKWLKKNIPAKKREAEPQNYAQWLQSFLGHNKKINNNANKYYTIGFSGGHKNHFCWYWDETKGKIVVGQGYSHREHFGGSVPYETWRGRYDALTHELSLAAPEVGKKSVGLTGKMERDVPPKVIKALNDLFKSPKIFYFPFVV